MVPYSETICCRSCLTRVTVAAARESGRHPAQISQALVCCPICDNELTLNAQSRLDGATIEIVRFECNQRD